jgi:hypothetical protein
MVRQCCVNSLAVWLSLRFKQEEENRWPVFVGDPSAIRSPTATLLVPSSDPWNFETHAFGVTGREAFEYTGPYSRLCAVAGTSNRPVMGHIYTDPPR